MPESVLANKEEGKPVKPKRHEVIDCESMTLEDAGKLLRRWQLNEWALDKKMTKKALKEQRQIVKILLVKLCQRHVADAEIEYTLASLN